jgi:hypothetical protein
VARDSLDIDPARLGSWAEATANAWLLRRGFQTFVSFGSHAICDIVAVKLGGSRPPTTLLIEVKNRTQFNTSNGLTEPQVKAGILLMEVYPDGHCELEAQRKKYTRKDKKNVVDT